MSISCEHNKRHSRCIECNGKEICKHKIIQYYCKDYKGAGICEHLKRRAYCKDCKGSSICEHNREKSKCKECGGNQICEHNKFKITCKDCKGLGICIHNKIKYTCRECGGSSICEHNKERTKCKECGGGAICEHNRQRYQCKECKGTSFCKHNIRRTRCKECGGSELCKHSKQKYFCKDCGGSQICEHNKHKANCKDCGGASICMHNKQKAYCKECNGSQLCKSSWCETRSNPKYENYCLTCFIHLFPDKPNTRNYKTKEKTTTDYILKQFPDFTWIVDKRIQDGCSRKRPDLVLDLGYQVIIEVDENQHQDYDCSCENKRLMELSRDVGHRPIVFIRFNPDEYNTKDGKVTSCWANNKLGICTVKKSKEKEWSYRLEALKTQIEYWINSENKTEKTIEIVQLFYDCN